MKYEILEPETELQAGDLCMFTYVSKNGNVKYKCGKHSTYTEPVHDGGTRLGQRRRRYSRVAGLWPCGGRASAR